MKKNSTLLSLSLRFSLFSLTLSLRYTHASPPVEKKKKKHSSMPLRTRRIHNSHATTKKTEKQRKRIKGKCFFFFLVSFFRTLRCFFVCLFFFSFFSLSLSPQTLNLRLNKK